MRNRQKRLCRQPIDAARQRPDSGKHMGHPIHFQREADTLAAIVFEKMVLDVTARA
ncbi:MAG: hypothetical protein WC762_03995 [Methylobacter sp.]